MWISWLWIDRNSPAHCVPYTGWLNHFLWSRLFPALDVRAGTVKCPDCRGHKQGGFYLSYVDLSIWRVGGFRTLVTVQKLLDKVIGHVNLSGSVLFIHLYIVLYIVFIHTHTHICKFSKTLEKHKQWFFKSSESGFFFVGRDCFWETAPPKFSIYVAWVQLTPYPASTDATWPRPVQLEHSISLDSVTGSGVSMWPKLSQWDSTPRIFLQLCGKTCTLLDGVAKQVECSLQLLETTWWTSEGRRNWEWTWFLLTLFEHLYLAVCQVRPLFYLA